MKISDAKQAYSRQLNTLQSQRQALRKVLQRQEKSGADAGGCDRVEIGRELERLDLQYDAVSRGMEGITTAENMIRDAAYARQQGEAMSQAAGDISKMLEVYRRIASGARVPYADEQKLLEYSHELYMAAKNMAFMRAEKEDKEYDSLWDDEKEQGEALSPDQIAGNSEVSVAAPEAVAAQAAAQGAAE